MDAAKIIDFTGWGIAGVSVVGIIKNAMHSTNKVKNFFGDIATLIDKITFWN